MTAPPAAAAPLAAPAFGGAPLAPRPDRYAGPVSAAPSAPAAEQRTATAVFEPAFPPQPVSPPATVDPPTSGLGAASFPTPQPSPAPDPVRATSAGAPIDRSGPLLPGHYEEVDEAQLAKSTILERVMVALAVVLPPIGLIGSIVAAARSSRRRGWVIGLLKVGIGLGVVFSIVAAGFGYVGYQAFRSQQAHAQTVAESAAFCAAMTKDPTLAKSDGGWPQPAESVPASLTTMQAFVDRWTALAKVAPAAIRAKTLTVAAAGTAVIKTVSAQRTVDDGQNRSLVESAVSSSGVLDWRAQYCG